ncbi:MAG: acetylglutamate kinase [Planctomycetota bacterium]
MRILVKIGGAQLEAAGPRAALCQAVARAKKAGHQVVIVHGGGNQIRTVGKAMGLQDRYHDGLRITDAATADVVLMVLGGLVNRTLVASLQREDVSAVGVSGADGNSFTARQLTKPNVDLGFVGAIDTVRPQLVQSLLALDHVPVIATVAPGREEHPAAGREAGLDAERDANPVAERKADGGPFFNLNADHAAGPLCRAFDCDALLFLTDVPGVLDAEGQRIARLSPADCERLVASGVAKGGMLPKLEAALMALRDNPRALVKIAPAAAHDAVNAALADDTGTRFWTDDTNQTMEVPHG